MNGTSSIRTRRGLPPGIAANILRTENSSAVVYIEAVLLPGGSGITLTGQRSEEFADRVRAAQSQVWSRAPASTAFTHHFFDVMGSTFMRRTLLRITRLAALLSVLH